MGEIGFSRDKFLYVLKWWEIKAIIDGYRKRERTYLLMTRWSTFMIMCTGMADMKKAGFYNAQDLLTFPWELSEMQQNMPTPEDFLEMDRILRSGKDGK